MRRIWLSLLVVICIFILSASHAYSSNSTDAIMKDVTKIEKELFSATFEKNNLKARLKRIENDIYGTEYPKLTNEQRIAKIKKDIGYANTVAQAPNQQKVAQKPQPQKQQSKFPTVAQNTLKEQDEADYPMVDKLEATIFKTSYNSENIYKRLDRLEYKVFGTTNQTSTLSDRVSALLKVVSLPQQRVVKAQNYGFSSNTPIEQRRLPMQQGPRQLGKFSSNRNFDFEVGVLEEQIYGRNFSSDDISQRLSRMETHLLRREYLADDTDSRIERIGAVILAQSTSKHYDTNKAQQYLSTGLQVGSVILLILGMIF